jgi:cysteinyl-tRNA synthetase
MILRSLILFSPYRSIISYSAELKEQYAKEYDKWQRAYKQALYTLQYNDIKGSMINESEINKFKEFMDDDFNVQNVLTLITDIVKEINVYTRSKDYDNLLLEVNTFKKILDVLGINLFIEEMNEEQLKCYKDWQDARTNKDFPKADIYRAKLLEWNIL